MAIIVLLSSLSHNPDFYDLETESFKKIKHYGKRKKCWHPDVVDFKLKMDFPEQHNANYFLSISSFSLSSNTLKLQNKQNNLFYIKDERAIPVKVIFRLAGL